MALNGPFSPGDLTVATATGGRWVAELGGSSRPKCRWLCGPSIAIAAPGDPTCDTAQASLTVAADGSIASIRLLYGGTCYSIAHPRVTISGAAGAGATATATVGEVTGLTLTDGGAGYVVAPLVSIAVPGLGGTQATATATINGAGAVTGLTLTSGGALYRDANPVVTIDPAPPGGRQARATAAAKPFQVTSLKLTSPGAGYLSNAVPSRLNFTVSSPVWSFGVTLLPGIQPGTAPGYVLTPSPPGGQGYCTFSATKLVDIPVSGSCPVIRGVTMSVVVANTVSNGWCVMVDFTVAADNTNLYPCPQTFNLAGTLPCLKLSGTYPVNYPLAHGPGGPSPISCPARPFAWTTHIRMGVDDRAYPEGEFGWYTLAGGLCPNPAPAPGNPQPNIFLDMTLSEP